MTAPEMLVWVAVDQSGKIAAGSVARYTTEKDFRRDYARANDVVLLIPGPVTLGSQIDPKHLASAYTPEPQP